MTAPTRASLAFTVIIQKDDLLTANQRLHWTQRSRRTKGIREGVGWLGKGYAPFRRAHCTVTINYPDRRRRDIHNLMPTVKACIDGFVDAGLLPDDDDTHLTGPDLRVGTIGQRGQIRLTFVFTEIP